MGGEPLAAFLSLALPRDLPQSWVGRFIRSLISLGERFGVSLAGGDTAESPGGILADIIVVGTAPKGKSVLRSGARPGDRIFVSGELGGSAATVLQMRTKPKKKLKPRDYPRHFYPEPRVELGRILREKGLVSAMIDTSDGLSTDLAHLCEESKVGAELESVLIPRASVGRPAREVDLDLALHGGEDYELLFTARPRKRIPSHLAGVALTHIGNITRSHGIFVRNLKGVGYELEAAGLGTLSTLIPSLPPSLLCLYPRARNRTRLKTCRPVDYSSSQLSFFHWRSPLQPRRSSRLRRRLMPSLRRHR